MQCHTIWFYTFKTVFNVALVFMSTILQPRQYFRNIDFSFEAFWQSEILGIYYFDYK